MQYYISGLNGASDFLSGLGTVAGAVGGMSGYDVHRGPYGMFVCKKV